MECPPWYEYFNQVQLDNRRYEPRLWADGTLYFLREQTSLWLKFDGSQANYVFRQDGVVKQQGKGGWRTTVAPSVTRLLNDHFLVEEGGN
jgi:hypothetical protein